MKYICGFCGWVYDEIIEGIKFETLAKDWECPICRSKKIKFHKIIEDKPEENAN